MKLAIHQPNFIPWIDSFIDLVKSTNLFSLIMYKKIMKSWLNRNKLIISNKPSWLTVLLRKKEILQEDFRG